MTNFVSRSICCICDDDNGYITISISLLPRSPSKIPFFYHTHKKAAHCIEEKALQFFCVYAGTSDEDGGNGTSSISNVKNEKWKLIYI
jgi:hypothetical protein